MEANAASVDECVRWLEQDVLDLLRLKGVIIKLSINWRQLKLSLREKGTLLGDNQSVDDLQGPTPPAASAGSPQAVPQVNLQGSTPPLISAEKDSQSISVDDLQGSTPPTSNIAEGAQAATTKVAFIGSIQPTDTSGHGESTNSIDLSTEPSTKESFIGPVIPPDAVKLTDSDVEIISVEPGPAAVGFIGPVIPGGAAKSTSELATNQTAVYVEDGETDPVTEQNGNGSMETSESPTVQSSDVVSMETGSSSLGDDYQKLENAVLYWHKTTGYIYDPVNQQFYAPTSSYYGQQQATTTATTGQTSQSSQPYAVDEASTSGAGQTSQTSISDMLAAASERVLERCGLEYDETAGMYYDANSALYYDQRAKLYYDPDLGSYYQYDDQLKTYTLHSRVDLPECQMRRKQPEREVEIILIDEDELSDSPEEGEIRPPKRRKIPRRSPPPEDEWAPCIRMLVSESSSLTKGTLFVVTQDGANIGREPTGAQGIKIPELQVSKSHATIAYNKRKAVYTITDHGSTNGTFLDDERLSEPKEESEPHPLSHGQTLTLGSTVFTLHIHIGFETCAWCDPAQWGAWQDSAKPPEDVAEEVGGSLDLQRRKELNRIKKRYGLRTKDTYGEKEVKEVEGYSDRAQHRRKTVGSQPPDFHRPDDAPSSVHRPISDDNVGRRMLKKLGWKEGEGLGKEGAGIAEPVRADIRDSKAGLGSSAPSRSMDSAGDSTGSGTATGRAHKMKQRYDDIVSKELERKKRELMKRLEKY